MLGQNEHIASNLVGKIINDKWHIKSYVKKSTHHTGGFFSDAFIVSSDEHQEAFMKVLDLRRLFSVGHASSLEQKEMAIKAYRYERDLLLTCKEKGLSSRVVHLIDNGVETYGEIELHYMVFEHASSDVRQEWMDNNNNLDKAWAMRTFHMVLSSIHRLHTHQITH